MREPSSACFVVSARVEDVPHIARLFVDTFQAHVVAGLPLRLRHRFIAAHVAFALVARDRTTNRIVGFTIGGRREDLDRARSRFVRASLVRLACHALLPRGKALRVVRSASRTEHASPVTAYELRYIAVAGSTRGAGIGTALLSAFEDTLGDQPSYYAWVHEDRGDALRFYRRHHFEEETRIDGHLRLIKVRR